MGGFEPVNPPDLPVLYEDNHLIVIAKPFNMPSQADPSGDLDALTAVRDLIRLRDGKPGNVYLGLVHRLDRPAGGVMVFAKTSKAASRLSDMIRSRNIVKEYAAVVHGSPPAPSGTLVHYLWKDPKTNLVHAVRKTHKLAKEAVLDYRTLGEREGLSLVRIRLHTGRTHQIRVQMAASGCPLYGDQRYGARVNRPGMQLALWSLRIAFLHPVRKVPVAFAAPPPAVHPWSLWNRGLYEAEWETLSEGGRAR